MIYVCKDKDFAEIRKMFNLILPKSVKCFGANMPKSVKCLTILEEKSHKSGGIGLFLLQLFFHPLYCHLEEEADEVLVSCFRTNHAEGRNVFLAGFGWDDEERMIQS